LTDLAWAPPVATTLSARELAERWPTLPHLDADEAEAFADDLAVARRSLPSAPDRWES
jgi:hypothetical protein